MFEQFPSYQNIGSKAYKPTLENILAITKRINSPQNYLKFVHVAGSNGKGSTCAMLASILTESGYKVGLFTSPHISDFTERIRINGACIPKEKVVSFIQRIKQEPFNFSPSFFEVTFAMALKHFKEEECDICIVETGLGGRLDATNIISPILSVITNISLEHTSILGDTLEEIAIEKAGIIKENTPVAFGKMPETILNQLISFSKKKNAKTYLTSTKKHSFDFPLLGEYQLENFQLVLNALSIMEKNGFSATKASIQKGLNKLTQNTGFAGRLQVMSENPLVIFDVSHNAAGIKATLTSIQKINTGELFIVFGASNDKDLSAIIHEFPEDASYFFTQFKNIRSCSVEQLKGVIKDSSFKKINFFEDAETALNSAKSSANQNDTILVIGSFFLIADFF